MKLHHIVLLSAFGLSLAVAQDKPSLKPPAKESKTAPEMTDALKAKYWKARARQIAAQKESGESETAMQAVITELQNFCGPGALLSGDRNGDASCQLKEPPEAAEKPATK